MTSPRYCVACGLEFDGRNENDWYHHNGMAEWDSEEEDYKPQRLRFAVSCCSPCFRYISAYLFN
jgi:hypothetical protein